MKRMMKYAVAIIATLLLVYLLMNMLGIGVFIKI